MAIERLFRRRFAAAMFAAMSTATAGFLVACGGNGEQDVSANDCQQAHEIKYASLQDFWMDDQLAEGDLGKAFTTGEPSVRDAPKACAKGASYVVASGALPPGMTLDATTGAISGAPAAAGVYDLQVSVTGPLFSQPVQSGSLQFQIRNPAAFAWSGWDDGSGGGRAISEGARSLNVLGDSLVLTYGGSSAVTTMRSTDGGAIWSTDHPPTAPAKRREFAVADDGAGHLYVIGGEGDTGLLDDVWVFDGTAWQQQAAHAGFGPRRPALVFAAAGFLFLYGDSQQGLTDLWRSADGGRYWTKVADKPFDDPDGVPPLDTNCGGLLNGVPVIVTSRHVHGTGQHPYTQVWSSPDAGATWQLHLLAESPNSPFMTLNGGGRQCAVNNGRFFVTGSMGLWGDVVDVASSADLDHWDYQPRSNAFLSESPLPGAVFLNGRLHLGYGKTLYTSQP